MKDVDFFKNEKPKTRSSKTSNDSDETVWDILRRKQNEVRTPDKIEGHDILTGKIL